MTKKPVPRQSVEEMFSAAAFIQDLGMRIAGHGEGWAESRLDVTSKHQQQHGFIHAGVQATMADHTAGIAATTMLDSSEAVLTHEFKINFLRPASGSALRCRSTVLKRGKTLIVCESEVFALDAAGGDKLVSKMMVTLSVVQAD